MDALLLHSDALATKEAIRPLEVAGFRVEVAGSIVEALNKLRANAYDLLVVHLGSLGPAGLDFLRTVRLLRPEQSVALIGPRRYVQTALDSVGGIPVQPFSWNSLAEAARGQLVLEQVGGRSYSGFFLSLFSNVSTLLISKSYSKAFTVLLEQMARVLQAERIYLLTLDLEGTALSLKAIYPANPTDSEGIMPAGEGLAAKVIEKGDVLIFPDSQPEEADVQLAMRAEGATSALGLPIKTAEKLQGVLVAYRMPPRPTFTQEDVVHLKDLLELLSLSVEFWLLQEGTGLLEKKASEKNEQLALARREIEALNKVVQNQMMSFQQLDETANALKMSYRGLLQTVGEMVERRKSPDPGIIQLQKEQWIVHLSKALGIEDERVGDLAFIYDIGMLGIPENLLHKVPGDLNEAERQQLREHVFVGERLAEAMAFPKERIKAVRYHHEKYDGSGYPDGLAWDEIPLLARILQVVDAYSTMLTAGFQKAAMSAEGALTELRRGAGHAYDPKVVEAFEKLLGQERAEPVGETEIISEVTHELRSPLTYLVGYSELLAKQKDLPPEALKWAEEIHSDALHMSRLVEELLEMTRLETGSVPLVKEEVDLVALIDRVVGKHRLVSESHTIVKQVPATLPKIMGDPDRLQEVLDNLLDNAIKYSPEGGLITITAKPLPGELEVSVADQGIGIPASALDKLFQKFYRVDNPTTKRVRGTGLGLSICKKIVEGHGGSIWAESEERKGSTFHFTIPLRRG